MPPCDYVAERIVYKNEVTTVADPVGLQQENWLFPAVRARFNPQAAEVSKIYNTR